MHLAQYPSQEQEPGLLVPQRVYTIAGQPDFRPLPPIQFHTPGQAGMSLVDALNLPNAGLPDAASTPVLTQVGTRVTLRILVSKQMQVLARGLRTDNLHSGQVMNVGATATASTSSTTELRSARAIRHILPCRLPALSGAFTVYGPLVSCSNIYLIGVIGNGEQPDPRVAMVFAQCSLSRSTTA
jgi:hypothetical protein